MGHAREKTSKLPAKLRQIRARLEASQDGILKYLDAQNELTRNDISKFERGIREPPLRIILRYARAVGISTDVLIDDEMDLPEIEI